MLTVSRNHTPSFKATLALAAIDGDHILAQLAEQFDVVPFRLDRGKHDGRMGLLVLPT